MHSMVSAFDATQVFCCCYVASIKKQRRVLCPFFRMVATALVSSLAVAASAFALQLFSLIGPGSPPSAVCEVFVPETPPQELVCVCSQEVYCQYPLLGPDLGRES